MCLAIAILQLTGERSPEALMVPRRGTQGTRPRLINSVYAWRTEIRTAEWPRTHELTRTAMALRTTGMGIAWRSLCISGASNTSGASLTWSRRAR